MSELEASLAAIAAQYTSNVGTQPTPAPSYPPQVPPGHYLASDGKVYPLAPQAAPPPPPAPVAAPPPPAPLPQPPAPPVAPPPPAAAPAPAPHAIPQAAAAELVQIHLQQPLPMNPPEAVQALDPSLPPPAERKRRGSKAKPAAAAVAATSEGDELSELLEAVRRLLPKGVEVRIQGEA